MYQLSLFTLDVIAFKGSRKSRYFFQSCRVMAWDGRFLGGSWVRTVNRAAK